MEAVRKASAHTARFVVGHEPVTHWVVVCGHHFTASGATYAFTEDEWRRHVYEATGVAPKPMGDKSVPRWQPEGGAA